MTVGSAAIRAATPQDVENVLDGYEWLFAPPGSRPPGWDRSAAEARLLIAIGSEAATVLVAHVGERIVGICTAYIDLLSVRYGVRCWVEDLATDPDFRSAGIGRELLAGARDWAVAHGASHLELDSGEARLDAHRFYEREGATRRSICFGWDPLEKGR